MRQEQRRVRTFEHEPAVRSRVPLWIALYGPSGCGKTMSALELATGIQRVRGGKIFLIDTEAGRGRHYARPAEVPAGTPGYYEYEYVAFAPPYDPLSYLDAFEHCVRNGAGVIITDSMSHEHNGIGGVLEMADATGRADGGKWSGPKAARLRAKNGALQLGVHFVFCFRGREKLDMENPRNPVKLGLQPEGGDEWLWEMTAQYLLRPMARGVPDWNVEQEAERFRMKLPEQFRHLLQTGEPLHRDMGEAMARWAEGGALSTFERALSEAATADATSLEQLAARAKDELRKQLNRGELLALSRAIGARRDELGIAKPALTPTGADHDRFDRIDG